MSKTAKAVIGLVAVVIQIVIIIWTLILVVPAVIASGHGVAYVFLILGTVVAQYVQRAVAE